MPSTIKVDQLAGATANTITVPSGQTLDISNATLTLPSNLVTTTGTQTLTNKTINASQLTDASIALSKLSATGTASASTFLRGDNAWGAVGGITEIDMWRLTSQLNGNQNPISTNLERADTYGFLKTGTGMTQSSGIFTFPSTGTWLVEFNAMYAKNGDSRANYATIFITINNSTYSVGSQSVSFIQQTEGNWGNNSAFTSYIFNVTNTTNCKCRFDSDFSQTCSIQGDTNSNYTYMNFIRLGDSK
jgi:hypothetical protein